MPVEQRANRVFRLPVAVAGSCLSAGRTDGINAVPSDNIPCAGSRLEPQKKPYAESFAK